RATEQAEQANRKQALYIAAVFVALTLAHLALASVGWFYRYEAYLVALGTFALGALIGASRTTFARLWKEKPLFVRALLAFLLSVGTTSLAARGAIALQETPLAMQDRLYEHIAPARFVARYYNRDAIVANDIGALTYYTDARVLDAYGLGSREPVVFRRENDGYGPNDLAGWASDESARLAILQVQWSEIGPRIPPSWIQIGEWVIPRNVVFGDLRVGIFALNEAESALLMHHLQEFAPEVPQQVRQEGPYVDQLAMRHMRFSRTFKD
ncbi:MAG: hypothetical protein NUV35_02460, partial [Syntrophomonadaceae bacterium]|nr:hypothetical protein [Syntrophomonadaceae bacterium]